MALTQHAAAWYAAASKPGTSYVPYTGQVVTPSVNVSAMYVPSGTAGGGTLTTYEFVEGINHIDSTLADIRDSMATASSDIISGVGNAISGVVDGLIGGVQSMANSIAEAFDGLVNIGRNIIDGIDSMVTDIIDGIGDGLSWLGDQIGGAIDAGIAGLKAGLTWIGDKISEIGGWLSSVMAEFAAYLWDKLKQLWDWFSSLMYEFIDWLGNKWDDLADKFRTVLENAFKSIADVVNWIGNLISDVVSSIIDTVGGWIKQAIDNMLGSQSDLLAWLKSVWAWIQEQAAKIWAVLTMSDEQILSIIKELITRIMSTIIEAELSISEAVYNQTPGA